MHARGCLAFRVAAVVVVRCLRRGVAAPHSRTPLLVSTWIGVLVRCVRRGVAAPHRRSSLPAAARAVLLCVRLRLVLLCVRRSFGRSGDHPPHDRDCPNDRHCGRCNPPNERECRAKHCPQEGECPKHCPSKTTWPHHRCLGLPIRHCVFGLRARPKLGLGATRSRDTRRTTADCGR